MSDGFILKKDSCRDEMITRIVRFLELLPMDRAWEVTVKRFRKQRSEDQNNALWGVAYPPLMEVTGYEKEEIHEELLMRWSGHQTKTIFGRKKVVPVKRSKELNTLEFCDYYAFVQRFAAKEFGIYIPDPDPALKTYGERKRKAA